MEHETLFPLLCKTADGDKKAFAELYKITSPQLYAVALKLLKRPSLPMRPHKMPILKSGITQEITSVEKAQYLRGW